MNSNRIKEIQAQTPYPESVSVMQALMQVWSEVIQQPNPMKTPVRKVVVYEWKVSKGDSKPHKTMIGHGIFHGFGCDYEEFETSPGNYSTAIVEMPSGIVINTPVELIVFNN